MPDSSRIALSDIALATSTTKAISYSKGSTSVPGYDAHLAWDDSAKTHTVQGQTLVTATISSVSVSGGVPTVTVNSTAGFVVGKYAVIAGLTANSWLNGTSRVNQVINSTQYQPDVAPHADQGATADSGTATVNPQTGNLGRFQAGDGTDITTIGPFGTLVIAPPSYSDQPCIELRPPASAAGTVPSLRWQSPYDPSGKYSTYFNESGDFYNLLIGVFSGHYQGSGPSFGIIPPTTPMPTVLEVNLQAWADDDAALAVRGADASQGVGHTCQVIGIDDVTNSFCWGVTSTGKFVFGSTQSVDANRMPLWDCGGPYRVSAGVIGFDGSVQIIDPSSPILTLVKGSSHGQVYNDGSMTLLGDSSSHAIVYRANNHNFFNYATSAFYLEIDAGGVHVGNVSGSGTANAQLESTPNSAGKPGLAIYTSAGVETLKVLSGAVIVGQGTGITKVLSATATLDFPSTAAQTSSELTITVTGAAVGDTVAIGLPAAPPANCTFSGYVSATDTVTIRLNNYSSGAIDPASRTYRATVIKF